MFGLNSLIWDSNSEYIQIRDSTPKGRSRNQYFQKKRYPYIHKIQYLLAHISNFKTVKYFHFKKQAQH